MVSRPALREKRRIHSARLPHGHHGGCQSGPHQVQARRAAPSRSGQTQLCNLVRPELLLAKFGGVELVASRRRRFLWEGGAVAGGGRGEKKRKVRKPAGEGDGSEEGKQEGGGRQRRKREPDGPPVGDVRAMLSRPAAHAAPDLAPFEGELRQRLQKAPAAPAPVGGRRMAMDSLFGFDEGPPDFGDD